MLQACRARRGNDSFTKLLLHMDGSNGGTSFPDDSAFNHPGTAHGANLVTSTAQKKFGSAALSNNASANTYLSVADHSDFAISSAWAVDFWFYMNAIPGSGAVYFFSKTYSSGYGMLCRLNAGGGVVMYMSSADGAYDLFNGASIGSISTGAWYHVAITWDGSTYRTFLSGVAGATKVSSSPPGTTTEVITIGAGKNATGVGNIDGPINGYIDEFRWSHGNARWTAAFAPPKYQYSRGGKASAPSFAMAA